MEINIYSFKNNEIEKIKKYENFEVEETIKIINLINNLSKQLNLNQKIYNKYFL